MTMGTELYYQAKAGSFREYRDKGKRSTTVKTAYGEVCYSRRVYERKGEGVEKGYVYLLDEAMEMEKIGLLSAKLAEKIAMAGHGNMFLE